MPSLVRVFAVSLMNFSILSQLSPLPKYIFGDNFKLPAGFFEANSEDSVEMPQNAAHFIKVYTVYLDEYDLQR